MRIESTPMNLDPASRSPQSNRKIIRNPYARKVLNHDEFDRPGSSEIAEITVDLTDSEPNEPLLSTDMAENTLQNRRKQRHDSTYKPAPSDQLYLQLLVAIGDVMRQTELPLQIQSVSHFIESAIAFKHLSATESRLLAELLDQEKWPEDSAWTYYQRFKHWLQKQAVDQKERLDFHSFSLKTFSIALLANCHVASALLHLPVFTALSVEKCVAVATEKKMIFRSGIARPMSVNLSIDYYRKVKEDIIAVNKSDHEPMPVLKKITALLRFRPRN